MENVIFYKNLVICKKHMSVERCYKDQKNIQERYTQGYNFLKYYTPNILMLNRGKSRTPTI